MCDPASFAKALERTEVVGPVAALGWQEAQSETAMTGGEN